MVLFFLLNCDMNFQLFCMPEFDFVLFYHDYIQVQIEFKLVVSILNVMNKSWSV